MNVKPRHPCKFSTPHSLGKTVLIPHASHTYLRSSNTNFVEKVIKAFLCADTPLYLLNNKHIKDLFHDIGHSLPFETTCRETVLQLSADELQRIRNFVHGQTNLSGC